MIIIRDYISSKANTTLPSFDYHFYYWYRVPDNCYQVLDYLKIKHLQLHLSITIIVVVATDKTI